MQPPAQGPSATTNNRELHDSLRRQGLSCYRGSWVYCAADCGRNMAMERANGRKGKAGRDFYRASPVWLHRCQHATITSHMWLAKPAVLGRVGRSAGLLLGLLAQLDRLVLSLPPGFIGIGGLFEALLALTQSLLRRLAE